MRVRRGRRGIVVAALLALGATGEARAEPSPAPPAESPAAPPAAAVSFAGVTLEDPDGRDWSLGELAGRPVLLVVADRSGSDQAVTWGRAVGAARPGAIAAWREPGRVTVVSVADLRSVPSFARAPARWAIDAMVDEQGRAGGPPLLLDWKGRIAARVDARPGVANARLYAPDGLPVWRGSGEPTPASIAALAAAIDRLVAGSAGDGGPP